MGAAEATAARLREVLEQPIARVDGSVAPLTTVVPSARTLVVVVEWNCPTSQGALRALAETRPSLVVVSQGRIEAAQTLVADTGAGALDVVVERLPYPISSTLGADTVPTFVLVENGAVVELLQGWDRERVAELVNRAGGHLSATGGLPSIKPGCQSRHTLDAATQQGLEREDEQLGGDGSGAEDMWELGWNDGLPVVPPTPSRVRQMLGDRDPATTLGRVGPAEGEVTFERLAACAVLAGCEPRYWPVVEAATRAVMDPAFNVRGVINTTHFASPWIIVNGPVRDRLGMQAGSNALGPGNRATATIGRAVRLLMQLTGGGTPGGLDQSTLGGQHKYTACLAERQEASPWEPWHVTLGHAASDSTVTVLAGEGAAGVSDSTSQAPEDLATTLALAVGNARSPSGSREFAPLGAEVLLVVCPEHATDLGRAGWSKQDLRSFIVEHNGGKFRNVDEIMLVVAGGDAGRFSAVIAPWAARRIGSQVVTRRIEIDT